MDVVLLLTRARPCVSGYTAAAPRRRFYAVHRRQRVLQLVFACRDLCVLAPWFGRASRTGIVCHDTLCTGLGLYDDEARHQGGRADSAAVTCAEPRLGLANHGGCIRDHATSILFRICRGV